MQFVPNIFALPLFLFLSPFFFLPRKALADTSLTHTPTIITPLLNPYFLLSAILILLIFVIVKLRHEAKKRKELEAILTNNKNLLHTYSKQIDEFGFAAASMLNIEDEKIIFQIISDSIIEHSDYQRLMISLFKDTFPHREVIGHAGLTDENVKKMEQVSLSKSYFESICSLGIKIGRFSYYIPHTMKHIFNQNAVLFGEGTLPESDHLWHPEDNLIVNMKDENNNIIGVISVDSSKSGLRPTDEIVRPLEIFASFISQIIIHKRGLEKQKDLEGQLQQAYKMEAIGNITGSVAHDFNNILGIIIGNSELALLESDHKSSIKTNLQEIKNAGIKARNIVQQLLSLSRKSESKLKPINIISTLEESISFLRSTLPSTIEIHQNIRINEATILVDPNQFYQVLLNLSTNAAHSMDKKGGILSISISSIRVSTNSLNVPGDLENGEYAKIVISDTGSGINQNIIHRIFEPHFTTKTSDAGTGMGLSQVKKIMEKDGGKITVSSKLDHGTTFTIYSPLITDYGEYEEVSSNQELKVGEERILFVDDDQSLLSLGKLMLEKLGYTVTAESNPKTALTTYSANPSMFDLIITDMTMPQMTGDMFAKEILTISPSARIILCTGYSDLISEEDALEMGIKGYYEKPLTIQAFSSAIHSALKAPSF